LVQQLNNPHITMMPKTVRLAPRRSSIKLEGTWQIA
jgi:hypothetical protein